MAEDSAALHEENAALKAKVQSLEDTVKIITKLYEDKVRYAEEEGTHKKLEAIHSQIVEAVALNETNVRQAIAAARKWSNDQHIGLAGQQLLDIVERALPWR